jgi:hypothetical protein
LERLSTLLLENGIFDPRTPSEAQECLNQIESAVDTRIRVSQKKSDEAVLIHQIQLLALKRGKTLRADRISEWFSQLLDTVCL